MSVLSIYDVVGQFIAFSCSMPGVVRAFVDDRDCLMLVAQDGALSAVVERPLSAKLELLFRKDLYDVAIGYWQSHSR
jgi:hypothetical protein